MALNSDELIDVLDEKAKSYLGDSYASMSSDVKEKLFRVIAESVVEYIQSNASVSVNVTVGGSTGSGTGTVS